MGLKDRGLRWGMKAVGRLMEDSARAEKLMKAVERMQQGKESVDDAAGRILNLSQLPSASDVKDLSRRTGRLRREAKKVLAMLDDIDARLDQTGT